MLEAKFGDYSLIFLLRSPPSPQIYINHVLIFQITFNVRFQAGRSADKKISGNTDINTKGQEIQKNLLHNKYSLF